ncbi:MAG TPA: hypothetical protein VGH88_03015, partial [Streptosporangiaceae bacterium]
MIPPAAQRAMAERAKATVTETAASRVPAGRRGHCRHPGRPEPVNSCVVVGNYTNFFSASAGASAAILGLLV